MFSGLTDRVCMCWIWFYTLVVILLGFTGLQASGSTCPGVCFCPSLSRIVYCPRKGLPFIPNGIPQETIQLNLNDNAFSNPIISKPNFTRYTDLEQLYLTGCGIEYIEVDTFIDNKKLKWLDVGKNKLKTISDFTFRDLTLEHLFLNDNPGVSISTRAFSGLKSTGLYIQNNGLDKLSLEVLRPMNGTLKTLWLDGNKFEKFNSQWLFLFRTLSHLRIGDNPLHCNCEATWLFDFYADTSRIFEGGSSPSCRSPGRFRGKQFRALQKDDFKCQLPVFKNVDVIFEQNTGKMTCLASGDPVPTIYWMKPDGDSEVFIPKSEDITQDMEGVMYVRNTKTNTKNRYQCVANNPAGNVTFSINVAWPTLPEYETDVGETEVAMNDISSDTKSNHKEIKILEKDEKKDDTKVEHKVIVNDVNSSKVVAGNMAVTQNDNRIYFTAADIVGAVVGTFLLTLIACLLMWYAFSRRQKKTSYSHKNGVNGHSVSHGHDMKKGPPSRYELDEVEHTMKMLDKPSFDIHV